MFSPAAVVTRSAGLFSPAPSVTHTTPHSLLKRSSSALSRNTPMSLTLTPAPIVPLATAAGMSWLLSWSMSVYVLLSTLFFGYFTASGCAPSTVQFVRDLAARAYFEYGGIPAVSVCFGLSPTILFQLFSAVSVCFGLSPHYFISIVSNCVSMFWVIPTILFQLFLAVSVCFGLSPHYSISIVSSCVSMFWVIPHYSISIVSSCVSMFWVIPPLCQYVLGYPPLFYFNCFQLCQYVLGYPPLFYFNCF